MIKIAHPYIETDIIIDTQKINTLVIEHPKLLAEFITELHLCLNNSSEKLRFIKENTKYTEMSTIEVVINYFSLSADKKLNTLLVKSLVKQLAKNELAFQQLFDNGARLLYDELNNYYSTITLCDDVDISSFIKMYSPTLIIEGETLLEKLLSYINLCVEFSNLKYLILISSHNYFEKDDIIAIFNHCRYKEVGVLFLEPTKKYSFEDATCIIIDTDLCELLD